MADLTRKTANLFDYQTMSTSEVDKYLKNDGTLGDSTGWNVSDYIPCNGQQFVLGKIGGNIPSFCLYDSNKIFIAGKSYNTGGVEKKRYIHINGSSIASFIRFSYFKGDIIIPQPDDLSKIMLNEGDNELPFEPYGWVHSLRKMSSATETITSGQTIYANGQPITTYMLKGNEEHTGTPSPQNPVTPNGCGERTSNLLNVSTSNVIFYNDYPSSTFNHFSIANNVITLEANKAASFAMPTRVEENTTYYIRVKSISGSSGGGINYRLRYYSDLPNNRSDNYISSAVSTSVVGTYANSFTTPQGCKYILTELYHDPAQGEQTVGELMVSSSSDYEPYGFKIPITSGGVTTNIYLGEVQTTRQIHKIVIDGSEIWSNTTDSVFISKSNFSDLPILGQSALYCTHFPNDTTGMVNGSSWWLRTYGYTDLATWRQFLYNQYAAGTPVTVWYVLETPTTDIVNEPLMKIGDYADSISNAASIPTTDGANSITIDTTVQPSEFTATWTGWHDSSVQEYDGTDWQ